ncbi:MAG: hypothetical protein J6A77_04240 [Lachnospiraceae bacterium]|nr:hypothetical protein [Lachnospiraceae bacterium]
MALIVTEYLRFKVTEVCSEAATKVKTKASELVDAVKSGASSLMDKAKGAWDNLFKKADDVVEEVTENPTFPLKMNLQFFAEKGGKNAKGHMAKWQQLDKHGNVVDSGISRSGGTKPGRILSWEEQLQTHTERKILDELTEKGTVSAGETIVIYGTKSPCNPGRSVKPSRECQKAMQDFATDNDVNILYFKEGDSNPWIFPR